MKRFTHLLVIVALCLLSWTGFGATSAAHAEAGLWRGATLPVLLAEEPVNNADAKLKTEFGKKLDLNNTNIHRFKAYRGLYPTLAKKIIANAPYRSVDEVLSIPGLSDRQKNLLKQYIADDVFAVTDPAAVFNEGADRINNGAYK